MNDYKNKKDTKMEKEMARSPKANERPQWQLRWIKKAMTVKITYQKWK